MGCVVGEKRWWYGALPVVSSRCRIGCTAQLGIFFSATLGQIVPAVGKSWQLKGLRYACGWSHCCYVGRLCFLIARAVKLISLKWPVIAYRTAWTRRSGARGSDKQFTAPHFRHCAPPSVAVGILSLALTVFAAFGPGKRARLRYHSIHYELVQSRIQQQHIQALPPTTACRPNLKR